MQLNLEGNLNINNEQSLLAFEFLRFIKKQL